MKKEIIDTPILIVRNIVIFPYMVIPLNVGRNFSIKAIEEALKKNSEVAIFTQKKINVNKLNEKEVYRVGILANIIKMVRLPDGTLRILVESTERVQIENLTIDSKISRGEVSIITEKKYEDDIEAKNEIEALYKLVKKKFEVCLNKGLDITPEIISPLIDIEEPGRLADIVVAQLDIDLSEKYEVLAERDIKKRLELMNKYLNKELNILKIKDKIENKVKKGMDESQKEFLLREQLRAIEDELGVSGQINKELKEYEKKIKDKRFGKEAREQAEKEIKRLGKLPSESSEAGIIRTYLDFIIELPWKRYSKSKLDIKKAFETLDKTHYGLKEVKERIIEYLSVKKISKNQKTPILCFVGPPGVGKTSMGKAIAQTMNREFVRISLGGVRDEAEIRGHRRTYVGAMPGRILRGIEQAGKSNPVFMLDEIDKLGADFRGDPASAMLEVLDPEQNDKFEDHYLSIKYDLSKVFFITTANRLDTIPRPLLDRMEVIEIRGYTENEKEKIAKQYLIPRQMKEKGLEKYEIKINDEALEKLILNYTREAGVRNLEREIGKLFRKMAKKIVMNEEYPKEIDVKAIMNYLGIEKYEMTDTGSSHDLGVATGLAWTEFGGDILNIEVALLKGNGKLLLTGNLGDVMQESAQTALTYIRTKIYDYEGDEEYYKNYDIHIHVPEGAVPKDGPSAGITLATALSSKLLKIKVPKRMAMTGEITLTGRILAIGGLREKLLAARLKGIKEVLVPKKNKKDVKEISDEIKKGLNIIYIEHMDEVLEKLFDMKM